jgi:hypothetical protein
MDQQQIHRICMAFDVRARQDILSSLLELNDEELTAIEEAIERYPEHLGSVGHDIHGLARCKTGPKYHRDTFLPRVVEVEAQR